MQPDPAQDPQPVDLSGERSEVSLSAHGRLNLTYWIIGTVPDIDVAQRCTVALAATGIAPDDLLVEPPGAVVRQLQAARAQQRQESFLFRIFDAFRDLEGAAELRAGYLAEARSGRALVGAHDVSGIQTDRIRNLLIEHHARYIHRFDPVEVSRLD